MLKTKLGIKIKYLPFNSLQLKAVIFGNKISHISRKGGGGRERKKSAKKYHLFSECIFQSSKEYHRANYKPKLSPVAYF